MKESKTVAKKPRKTKGAREDVVIRISKGNHSRLKALIKPVAARRGGQRDESVNELLNRLLDASETLIEGQTLYVVGSEVFELADEARGVAVMHAARFQEPVVWPKVAVVIGEDQI